MSSGELIKGSETTGLSTNGVYVVIQIDDNFLKCIGGNNGDEMCFNNIPLAKFEIQMPFFDWFKYE